MFNFDYIKKEDRNLPQILYHPYRILIVGASRPGKQMHYLKAYSFLDNLHLKGLLKRCKMLFISP